MENEGKAQPYVLVLEDDGPTGELLATIIDECFGLPVQVMGDGIRALGALDRAMPLAVLVDIMVPRLDGREFMAEVRHRFGRLVPLIVTSALPEAQVEDAAVTFEAAALPKPFSIDDLLAALADAVAPCFAAALGGHPGRAASQPCVRALRAHADLLHNCSRRLLPYARNARTASRLRSGLQASETLRTV